MIVQKGELAKRAQKHKIDWPGLVFLGYADKEPFVDVEFITLQQRCLDLVIPEAIEYCAELNIDGDQESMIQAYLLKNNRPAELKEFVSCFYATHNDTLYVTVGVNVSEINDEAEEYGFELLQQVTKFESGVYQEFGNSSTFKPLDAYQPQ